MTSACLRRMCHVLTYTSPLLAILCDQQLAATKVIVHQRVSNWVWVKIKPLGDRRFWSMFPLTRVPFGVPILDPQPTAVDSYLFLGGAPLRSLPCQNCCMRLFAPHARRLEFCWMLPLRQARNHSESYWSWDLAQVPINRLQLAPKVSCVCVAS